MKKLLFLILCITCFSCASDAKGVKSEEENIEIYYAYIDTLRSKIGKLEKDNETLNLKIGKLETDIVSLDKKVDSKSSKLSVKDYAFIIVLVLLIVCCLYIFVISKQNDSDIKILSKKHARVRRDIDFITNMINKKSEQSDKTNIVKRISEIENLEHRLDLIENIIKTINIKKDVPSKPVPKNIEKSKVVQEAYFGMVKGDGFFNDIYTVDKDECLFKIKYLSDTAVSFVPLDLKKIRFIDGIEKAVCYIGEKSIKEATSFVIKAEGYAVKENDVWYVKDRVEIILK